MALHSLCQILVDALASNAVLDGRFANLRLVNIDSSGSRQGVLSLVFSADDLQTGSRVAVKFFDPSRTNDVYRLTCFQREHEILKSLVGVPRCLQLASALSTYQLSISDGRGGSASLPCQYFAVDWIDGDLTDHFLRQEAHTPIEKLELLDEIVQSVQTLHSRGVFHRDIKHDNLRLLRQRGQSTVVLIDMGTAAQLSSLPIATSYERPSGAVAWSAPEARCGLAGNRLIARFTDVYAVGCLLFELFNRDHFYRALLTCNPSYEALLVALGALVGQAPSDVAQQRQLNAALDRMGRSFGALRIDGEGSDVPPAVASLLNDVLVAMTNVDYRRRPTLEWVRRRISAAVAVLRNENAQQARLRLIRIRRQQRLDKLQRREARLNAFRALPSPTGVRYVDR